MRASILAAAFVVCSVAQANGQAQAELKTFCLESDRQTCVDIGIETQPSAAGGTDVSIRIASAPAQASEGTADDVPWYRLQRVDLIAADAAFQGGDVVATSAITLLGAAKAQGDVAHNWPAAALYHPGRFVGYSIAADDPNRDTAIIGCIMPPGQRHSYIQTCDVTEPAAVLFRFSTAGFWQAEQMMLVIALHDQYAGAMRCVVGGTFGDEPDAHSCNRTSIAVALPQASHPQVRHRR